MKIDLQETGSTPWTLWLRAGLCFAVAIVAVLDVAWVASGRVKWEGLLFGIPGALAFGATGVALVRRARGGSAAVRGARQVNGAA